MNRILLIAVSVAVFFNLAIITQPLKAQVYDEYGVTTVVRGIPYAELGSSDNKDVLPASTFRLPPMTPGETGVRARDDGFYEVDLPFPYEYNGEVYTSVWICVNGYIVFLPPTEQLPTSLVPKHGAFDFYNFFFYYNASYPKNIVAPFMGDHFYRDGNDNTAPGDKYMLSEISTGATDLDGDNEADVFTVQWKNLNINYDDPDSPLDYLGIKSSVGNFQVKLYKSEDVFSKQGNIEFCYGQIGGNTQTSDTRVITKGAAIGLKGNSGKDGEFADFINGLYNVRDWEPEDLQNYDKNVSRNVTTTTVLWQPSGGSDYRVVHIALGRNQAENYWGDGDVNLSKLEGQKHANMSQSRYVTVTDARNILRSIVTRMPLPKERRREAYHADVNHNGRYILYNDLNWNGWNTAGTVQVYPKDTIFKKLMDWKNDYYGDSVQYILHDVWTPAVVGPPAVPGFWTYDKVITSGVNSLSQIFFEATEYDAALILHYIGGRIPKLPYLPDTVLTHGKITENGKLADNFSIGSITALGNNTYKIPVYLNGYLNGPLAAKASFNGTIENITVLNEIASSYEGDMMVLAGTDDFNPESPICFVTLKTDENTLRVNEIRFNDKEKSSMSVNLVSVEETGENEILLQNVPNPFVDNTVISLNLVDNSNYTLRVYDALGNVVKTWNNVSSGDIKWDGLDDLGNKLAQGVYIYRLTGDNLSVSKKLVLSK
ncbi:MAG: T9SS type A sorting domain-containing protein [bacterium]